MFDKHVGDMVSPCMAKLCQTNRIIKMISRNYKQFKALHVVLSQTPGNLIKLHLHFAKLVGCPSRNISNIGILFNKILFLRAFVL